LKQDHGIGYLLGHGSGYGVVFTLAGTFHVSAFAVILATVPAIPPFAVERKLSYLGTR
jgi:ABC-type phosphate transport system permease subunit